MIVRRFIVFISLLGLSVAADDSELAVNTKYGEITIMAPYYDTRIRQVSRERKSLDVEVMSQLSGLMTEMAYGIFIEGSSSSLYSKKFESFIKKRIKEYKELTRKEPNQPRLPDVFIRVMVRMLNDTVKEGKNLVTIGIDDIETFRRKLFNFGWTLRQIVIESPVGLYLNWRKVTIDGTSIPELAPYFVNFFAEHGKRDIIKIFESVIGKMKR